MTYKMNKQYDDSCNLDYKTKIPLYNWRRGDIDDWNRYNMKLNTISWNESTVDMNLDMKIEHLYYVLEEAVSETFKLKDINSKKKRKIPRKIKKLFSRKSN